MDNRSKSEVARMLATLAADVYGREMSEDGLRIYAEALGEFSAADVRDALNRHVRNPDSGQYMPKPADIVRMIRGSTIDSASQAWAVVRAAVARVGSYADVVFDDALIHRVIEDMGGWALLCAMREDEEAFKAQEFTRLYRSYAARGQQPSYQKVLAGRITQTNVPRGFERSAVTFIGERLACERVMAGGEDGQALRITQAPRRLIERVRNAESREGAQR